MQTEDTEAEVAFWALDLAEAIAQLRQEGPGAAEARGQAAAAVALALLEVTAVTAMAPPAGAARVLLRQVAMERLVRTVPATAQVEAAAGVLMGTLVRPCPAVTFPEAMAAQEGLGVQISWMAEAAALADGELS
ncbi:hypothetical protein [Chelativorans sp.]|uniref:hypothetical protein n=1 Tax=Chelativorans sp. TaxID=2203393 RepID=UPI002810C4DB|nr:hypothetical protein [Chelativorans sp.]